MKRYDLESVCWAYESPRTEMVENERWAHGELCRVFRAAEGAGGD